MYSTSGWCICYVRVGGHPSKPTCCFQLNLKVGKNRANNGYLKSPSSRKILYLHFPQTELHCDVPASSSKTCMPRLHRTSQLRKCETSQCSRTFLPDPQGLCRSMRFACTWMHNYRLSSVPLLEAHTASHEFTGTINYENVEQESDSFKLSLTTRSF